MISLVQKRMSNKNVYLHFDDGYMYSVNKMPISKYREALKLCDGKENIDFLYLVSTRTNDSDVNDSYMSKAF